MRMTQKLAWMVTTVTFIIPVAAIGTTAGIYTGRWGILFTTYLISTLVLFSMGHIVGRVEERIGNAISCELIDKLKKKMDEGEEENEEKDT